MSTRPSRYTSEEILVWLNAHIDEPKEIRDFLKECRQKNIADNLSGSHHLYDIIVEAIVTNDVKHLNLKRLIEARDALAIITSISHSEARLTEFQKKNPLAIDPDQILRIIELALQLLLMLMKYLENSKFCQKQKDPAIFNQALQALNGTNPLINLAGIRVKSGNLDNVDLRGVNLQGASFSLPSMKDAKFDDASLRDVTFKNCDLSNASFINSDLSWTQFHGATLNNIQLSERSLKDSLKTNLCLPASVSTPCCDDVKNALKEIHDDLKSELNLEQNPIRKKVKKIQRHFYHHLVSNNIVNITQQIKDPTIAHDMLLDIFKHHFFSAHRTAKITKAGNKLMVSVHNLFTSHRKDVPYICNQNQNPIRKALKIIDPKLGDHVPEHANNTGPKL